MRGNRSAPSSSTDEVALRPAGAADAPALWRMLAPVFRAGETYAVDPGIDRGAALALWWGNGHAAYVAELGGAIAGTYYLCPNAAGRGAHVANAGFVTDTGHGGRGVATAMLADALARARAAGFHDMQFNFVVETNAAAIRLWQTHGFTTVGRLPGAFAHPTAGFVDALVMHRTL